MALISKAATKFGGVGSMPGMPGGCPEKPGEGNFSNQSQQQKQRSDESNAAGETPSDLPKPGFNPDFLQGLTVSMSRLFTANQ